MTRAAGGVQPGAVPLAGAVPLTAVPKVGLLAWSFAGVVVAMIVVVAALLQGDGRPSDVNPERHARLT